MNKICCFGELLLRMSPALNKEWIRHTQMNTYLGGAELNVATALANWGAPVKYMTALPDHYLSKEILEYLAALPIDVSDIDISGKRIGMYILPQGAELKNLSVIYDREGSSFSELRRGKIDWDKVLEGCSWFHFSAISPGLNPTIADLCKEALEAATAMGLTISVDLNHRAKLWQYGVAPTTVMPELLQYCDVVMGNLWAAESLLGIPAGISDSIGKSEEELKQAAIASISLLTLQYPRASVFAYTFRLAHIYFALARQKNDIIASKLFEIGTVTDKVGTGDCFMAGLIYGLHQQEPLSTIINYAAAAAVGKLGELGDSTKQQMDDIKKISQYAK